MSIDYYGIQTTIKAQHCFGFRRVEERGNKCTAA